MAIKSTHNTTLSMPDFLGAGKIDLLQAIEVPPKPVMAALNPSEPRLRLILVDEINEENPSAYRSALANVYAALDDEDDAQFLYLLDGGAEGVALYFGVIEAHKGVDGHEALKNLRSALEGQLPGINLSKVADNRQVLEHLRQSRHQGVVLGVPTTQGEGGASEDEDFQGIERLVRSLMAGSDGQTQNTARWQLAVVCQPLSRAKARQHLNEAYDLASEISALVSTSIQSTDNTSEQKGSTYNDSTAEGTNDSRADSKGKSDGLSKANSKGESEGSNDSYSSSGSNSGTTQTKTLGTSQNITKTTGSSHTKTESTGYSLNRTSGNSLGITQELTNKRSQHLLEHLEECLIPRLQKGVSKGLFATAIYLCADTASTYRRLKNTVCATYQGGEATASPLEVMDLSGASAAQVLQLPVLARSLSDRDTRAALFHSQSVDSMRHLASLLTSEELAVVAGLPRRELQGLRRRKTVDFVVALPHVEVSKILDLGEVIDRGRRQPSNRVRLNKNDFNKHTFITGVTGAGKTTTCLNLLIESSLPFLVIEPAKTEYRDLHSRMQGDIDYYRPNGDVHRSLRLNPFALLHKKQKIKSHASFLRNVFAAIFPMEASMPFLVEQAILRAYEEKGWDLNEDSYLGEEDPFDPIARAWPTMSDMIRQLDVLIPEQGMGKEFEEKYRGSLVSRLTSLTHGVLGDVLDVPQSLDFHTLLDRHVVIELEEIKDGEGKGLMMALLLGAVGEAVRIRHSREPGYRHLTLVEEAHRLLARPDPGDKAKAMAVDAFADMLAEVRKYGEGLIIADQIPAKLIPDVIKNTHTKIVHRLFAEDDRRAMGDAMMMDDGQRDFLPNLATGEAIVFCGGWHGSAHAAIRSDHAQTDRPPLADEDIEQRAIAQLWRERQRYYPLLCRLGWLSRESDSSADFANFVRASRGALNAILALNPKAASCAAASDAYRFQALKKWLAEWQNRAITVAVDEAAWAKVSGLSRPGQPLTAPLLALIADNPPRARTQDKNVPLWTWSATEWEFRSKALDALLEYLAIVDDVESFKTQLNRGSPRELLEFLKDLAKHKSF